MIPSPGTRTRAARRRFANPAGRHFGYDAVAQSNRRRMAAPILRSEDWELQQSNRRQLVASQQDLGRNFAVARWLFERHLDYVTKVPPCRTAREL